MSKSKPALNCVSCAAEITKNDACFVDEDSFTFLPGPPKGLAEGGYCVQCFTSQVAPELEVYNEKLERAKNVNVYFAAQSKESRFVRRYEKPIKVTDCADRDEAVLRLAFLAVEAGKNSIVDVDLKAEKIRTAGYQTSNWSGTAIPADITDSALQKRR